MATSNKLISVQHLVKEYNHGTVKALNDCNLDIAQGEVVAIIGPSGSGKSTLLRSLNLLEEPTGGQIFFDGVDLADKSVDINLHRQKMGMVFQHFNLFPHKTVLQNITMAPLALKKKTPEEAQKQAMELLERIGLADKANEYPNMLSGGQKQRIAIARALANEPKVLLCDEATSALDPTTTRSILSLLKEINERLGITIIVITHEMRVVEEICSRVAILDASHVAEMGKVEEIFRRPKTAAARRLLFPGREQRAEAPAFGAKNQRMLRIVFDGMTPFEPVIANMVLACGAPVNILFANTRAIEGKTVGQMIVQLPEAEDAVSRIEAYLNAQNVHYEEVTDDVL